MWRQDRIVTAGFGMDSPVCTENDTLRVVYEMCEEEHVRQVNDKAALAMLRRAGLTERAIHHLGRFRRDYAENEMDQAPADLCRFKFVRWPVATGKLTDHTGQAPLFQDTTTVYRWPTMFLA